MKRKINGEELKVIVKKDYDNMVGLRYNWRLDPPNRMIARLAQLRYPYEIHEYQTSLLDMANVNLRIEYGDGSKKLCNGRTEDCARMVARISFNRNSKVIGELKLLE